MSPYNFGTNVHERDELFFKVVEFVVETQKASASLIQRKFKLGYARSAMLLDELEQAGIIGPINGANPRLILINNLDDVDRSNPPKIKIAEDPTPKLKWNKTVSTETGFSLEIGKDEKGNDVSVDLDKYGNVIMVGSQITSITDLTNKIVLEKVKSKSPEELKLIIIDGFINQIELPDGAPHLLTPIIRDSGKVEAALMWLHMEIIRRYQPSTDNKQQPKILLVIHGFNEIISFSPKEVEDRIALILGYARKSGVYVVITTDYIDGRLNKWILANNGAKIVFRPTTRQMARSSGVFESIKLESPDQAILDTMFESKKKFTISKVNVKREFEKVYK